MYRGVTGSLLAQACGVDRITLKRWEAGVGSPRMADLLVVADRLKVTPGVLLAGPSPADLAHWTDSGFVAEEVHE
jgi:transcriptional regulator with XRE-family HTH domain